MIRKAWVHSHDDSDDSYVHESKEYTTDKSIIRDQIERNDDKIFTNDEKKQKSTYAKVHDPTPLVLNASPDVNTP